MGIKLIWILHIAPRELLEHPRKGDKVRKAKNFFICRNG
ncbi:hypothetical protein V6Z12_A03G119700 [Gossypium hirsutum]